MLFNKENAFFGFASAAENDQQGGSCGGKIGMRNGAAVSALKAQNRDYSPSPECPARPSSLAMLLRRVEERGEASLPLRN